MLNLAFQNTSLTVFHKQLCFLNKINLSGRQWESRVLVKIGASIRSFPSWWQIRTLKRKVHSYAGCLNDSFFTRYSLGLRCFWKKESIQLAFKVTKPSTGPPWLARPCLDFEFQYDLIRNNWSNKFGIEYWALPGSNTPWHPCTRTKKKQKKCSFSG